LVLIPDHVDVLYAIEVSFPFANFFAVEIHLLVGCVPLLVELVDDQSGVAVDIEALDPQFNG
jgi:hypothetical protein